MKNTGARTSSGSRLPRTICFATGTRAEFGLMRSTLAAIQNNSALRLQIAATGMHLDRSRGYSLKAIRDEGYDVDAVVAWKSGAASATAVAERTGKAMAALAGAFNRLGSEIVLVVGDRVEALAAASAAHISGRLVAHVHGGDRALGLVDDSLRHAITKLAHVHLAATRSSADRIIRMGEDGWRVHCVGSPGLDDIAAALGWRELKMRYPELDRRQFALLVLHPEAAVPSSQARLARTVLGSALSSRLRKIVAIYPNNDPGAEAIADEWNAAARNHANRIIFHRNLPRSEYLGLLREASVLIGNSSSGIIEAASFGTPVLDIGSRQRGRERGDNIVHAEAETSSISRAIKRFAEADPAVRFSSRNIYGRPGTGVRIASILAGLDASRHLKKLIRY